jgi:hypothetical protein
LALGGLPGGHCFDCRPPGGPPTGPRPLCPSVPAEEPGLRSSHCWDSWSRRRARSRNSWGCCSSRPTPLGAAGDIHAATARRAAPRVGDRPSPPKITDQSHCLAGLDRAECRGPAGTGIRHSCSRPMACGNRLRSAATGYSPSPTGPVCILILAVKCARLFSYARSPARRSPVEESHAIIT